MIVSRKNSKLAQLLSARLEKPLIGYEPISFADTETLINLDSFEHTETPVALFVCQFSSFCLQSQSSYHVNNELLQLLLVASMLKQRGVKKLVGLLPYLPYTRHDKKDAAGNPGHFESVGKLLQAAGFDEIITCDIHSEQNALLLPLPLRTISLVPLWADFLKQQDLEKDTCIATPDVGGVARAQELADALGLELVMLEKKRIGIDLSVSLTLTGDVAEKRVIVIDDIIDTAGTALHAYQTIRQHGARRVEGCFSHAVLSSLAQRFVHHDFFDKLYVTNSLGLDQKQFPKAITVVPIEEFLVHVVAEEKDLW